MIVCEWSLRQRVVRTVVAILVFAPLAGVWAYLWVLPQVP